MNSSLLAFTQSFRLNNTPNDILLTDTTPWVAQGIALSQVAIVFELASPAGVFYSNINYATPDINRVATDHFSTVLPLDVNGAVITGQYPLIMSAKVTAEAFSYGIVLVDQANQKFVISGNYLASILNAIGGAMAITSSTGNDGAYTIDDANCSYDIVNDKTYIAVTGVIPSAVADGDINWTEDTIYTVTNSVNFCFVEPSIKLESTSDCSVATLEVHDTTDYTAYICGVTTTPVTPTVINRVLTVIYPTDPVTGLPVHAAVTTSTDTLTIYSPDLWTGDYQITVVTQLEYILSDGSVVMVTVTGYESHTVECDNNLCCAYQCMSNIFTNYLQAKIDNPTEANTKWLPLLIKLMGYWMLVTQAHQCGDMDAYQTNLAALINLVKANNCSCCPPTTTAPTRVVPLFSVGGGTSNTAVVVGGYGITVTAVTVGKTTTYTVAINTTILNAAITAIISAQLLFDHANTVQGALVNDQVVMYDSSTGKWKNVLITMSKVKDIDLVTNPPANEYILTYNAVSGKAEFLPVTFKNVLCNDIAPVGLDAALTEKTLKAFTMNAGELVTIGDYVYVEMVLNSTNFSGATKEQLRIYFGLTPSLLFNLLITTQSKIRVEMTFNKVSNTSIYYEAKFYMGLLPTLMIASLSGYLTETSANALSVRITGQNTGLATANTLVAEYLKIVKFNK